MSVLFAQFDHINPYLMFDFKNKFKSFTELV